MSRSKRINIDKKRGRFTTAGKRNGQEKGCRARHCSCGGKGATRLMHKQDRQAWRQDRTPSRKWQ